MATIHNILTKEEKLFVKNHNLDEADFYDARNDSSVKVYHDKAKQNGCHFVIYRESTCGHRLKTRSGHCIICNPARIAFQKRETIKGVLYIATSGVYCKVGVIDYTSGYNSEYLIHRIGQLNSEGGYAGITGWKLYKAWNISENVGKVEREVHRIMSKYQIIKPYIYSGELRDATELFKCSKTVAEKAINITLNNG